MAIEIRNPSEDERRAAQDTGQAAFGYESRDEDFARERKTLPLDRLLAAYDDGQPVATAASYPFELTIPGGQLPAAGVTWVAVLPSHRRRGILTSFMRHQLDELHERGEPLAILGASEAAIYGRFGYGIAVPGISLDGERARFGLRGDPAAAGSVRMLSREDALAVLPPVFERVRAQTPGMFARTESWWSEYKTADPEHVRRGASPKFFAALELDGEVEGYAIYRIKEEWAQGMPRSQVRVLEALGTSPTAIREIWRFLFSIDLIERVQVHMFDVGSGLFLMVNDPRSLHLGVSDGLWLRLVDVDAALRARSYAEGAGPVVLEVRDELCPWNAGRWRVGGEVEKTTAEPDLALDVADLACPYLGAFDFHGLAAAERVQELRPGALERASVLFRTTRPPFCAEEF